MTQTQWKVTYKDKEGTISSTNIEWPGEPSRDQAAVRIRERLLGDNYLLVDTPRGHSKPTVFLLNSYGFEITGIEEVEA